MPARLATTLCWLAGALAVLTFAIFCYRAFQPDAYNPVGLVAIGAGSACILWIAGLTCKYLTKSEQFVTKAECAACGHTGIITWEKQGAGRKLVSSTCFQQPADDRRVLCKRCGIALQS